MNLAAAVEAILSAHRTDVELAYAYYRNGGKR